MGLPIGASTNARRVIDKAFDWPVEVNCVLEEELPQEQEGQSPRAGQDWQQWKWDEGVDGRDGSVQPWKL